MAIEVEIKAFLTESEYARLLELFNAACGVAAADYQETQYYEAPTDLRIQRSDHGAKLIVKSGDPHDTIRRELEVRCERDDFAQLEQVLAALGYSVKVKWFRTRHTYQWNGVTVTLDATKGNGYLLELELITTPEHAEGALAELRGRLGDLGVQETPLGEMKKRFKHYAEHWQELTADQR